MVIDILIFIYYLDIIELKKLKRFIVTVKINEKQSKVEINHIVKINEN